MQITSKPLCFNLQKRRCCVANCCNMLQVHITTDGVWNTTKVCTFTAVSVQINVRLTAHTCEHGAVH
jgi:hypothetical protein